MRNLTCNNLLTYPDPNKTLKIHTNARMFQLGAIISQKGKPFDFYGIKFTYIQQRYTVTEREIIGIVETLKYFRTILLGQKFRIYTDKNFTCKNINIDIVLRWRLILKENGPYIEHI